ncbi:MAG TPA: wax ester/triacylglycerol synthase family O-acyltransferase [Candidatus Binatia bacterium]|nr:wax ester/triacylglycerol synthase family O-acyltransferase [Candidatus Binatia bacterium]
MADLKIHNSFSWGDALFLYIERPGQPLSIACVSIFEGLVSLKACRDFVESKLHLIPRYTQRVVFPPFNIGLPSWQSDPAFDIRNHIRQVTLRHGRESDLKALASKIVSTNLDRQRPLWDLTLVRGLGGNRTGMVARIHHCLADGIAGVGIMNVLMDPSPVPPALPRRKPVFHAPASRDAGAQLLDSLLKSYFSAVKGALTLHSEALNIAQEIIGNPDGPLADLMNIMPEIASPAERLPFNVVCHGPQKFGWTEISMSDIQAIRQSRGGTVNDVLLTVMAAALRRYSELRGARVRGRSIRIMIPVNVRGKDDVSELGNRISFLPVAIPLDIRDPQKLFAFVRERMEYLKRARAAEFVGFAGGLFSTIPTAIWAAIGPLASQLPLSLCNIICTNVPGPQIPLYLLGHKMLSWYPYVPIGGEMGVNSAMLSYNGKAYFGFTCDVGAVPDPKHLEKFVNASFAELRRSSSSGETPKPAPERPRRPKRRRPNAQIPLAATPSRTPGRHGRASSAAPTPVEEPEAPQVAPGPAAGRAVAAGM